MISEQNDLQMALVSWINSFELDHEKISDLRELRDGIILMEIMNKMYINNSKTI